MFLCIQVNFCGSSAGMGVLLIVPIFVLGFKDVYFSFIAVLVVCSKFAFQYCEINCVNSFCGLVRKCFLSVLFLLAS